MVSPYRLNLITYVISFMFCHCDAVRPFCSAAVFGSPPLNDCIAAFNKIPFAANYKTSTTATKFQLYGEPQYLAPPFGSVINRYAPRPINQIPKIWQYNRCRVAIISYGDGSRRGIRTLFGASWKQILEQLEAVRQCVYPVQGGTASGGWAPFISQTIGKQTATLYIYSADSPFVNYVNRYMTTGWAIAPPTSESQLISLLGNHSSITNQSAPPSSLTPNILVNVTFLDQTD